MKMYRADKLEILVGLKVYCIHVPGKNELEI